jgi:predicted AlkP superfamily pyrophosphatase or phosphodiesterase
MQDIRTITPTICRLLGIEPPSLSSGAALDVAGNVERVLVYCPDAIGTALVRDFADWFAPVLAAAPQAAALRSMVPPKTPVCFASMFTGALPTAHGIQAYERPVLGCDTLFDAVVRSGRKVALAAVKNSSVDLIFRRRPLDYFSEAYDPEVTARALDLIHKDRHDLTVVYHQEYDDCLHRTTVRSEPALAAARHHIEAFVDLAQAAARAWHDRPYAIMFCPDHGGHDADGRGTHGDDIPDDMEITHFLGIFNTPGDR